MVTGEVADHEDLMFRALFPQFATQSLHECVRDASEISFFAYRIFEVAEAADKAAMGGLFQSLLNANIGADPTAIINMMRKHTRPEVPVYRRIVGQYEKLMAQMTLCRAVDNYLVYVTSILREVFWKRPEILKSDKKHVSTKDVLKHPDLDSFILWLAECEVQKRSFEGIERLQAFFVDRLGIALLENERFDNANRLIEMRNLLVHNRGIINDRFISRVGTALGTPGESIEVTLHDGVQASVTLWTNAVTLDGRAIGKFALPTSNVWRLNDNSEKQDNIKSK